MAGKLKKSRSKMVLDLEDLEECVKVGIKEPGTSYLVADPLSVLKSYEDFFQLAASRTGRLNPSAVAKCGRSQFGLTQVEGQLFGQSLAGAFSHMKRAGDKLTTGEKADPLLVRLYRLMKDEPGEPSSSSVVKQEAGQKDPPVKKEAMESEPPGKKVKAEPTDGPVLSPSKVLSIYGHVGVKKEQVGLPSTAQMQELL